MEPLERGKVTLEVPPTNNIHVIAVLAAAAPVAPGCIESGEHAPLLLSAMEELHVGGAAATDD